MSTVPKNLADGHTCVVIAIALCGVSSLVLFTCGLFYSSLFVGAEGVQSDHTQLIATISFLGLFLCYPTLTVLSCFRFLRYWFSSNSNCTLLKAVAPMYGAMAAVAVTVSVGLPLFAHEGLIFREDDPRVVQFVFHFWASIFFVLALLESRRVYLWTKWMVATKGSIVLPQHIRDDFLYCLDLAHEESARNSRIERSIKRCSAFVGGFFYYFALSFLSPMKPR